MNSIRVPSDLLLDPDLTKSAKLIWMLWQSGIRTSAKLRTNSGLTRPTVLRSLHTLSGWLESRPFRKPIVDVPIDLLLDCRLSAQARLLYAILMLGNGQFTYTELCKFAHTSRNAIRRAFRLLDSHHWLSFTQENRKAPICYTLHNPIQEAQQQEVEAARERIESAKYKGQAIAWEMLTLCAADRKFEQNARPDCLENPGSHEPMEFDFFSRETPTSPAVAAEFQGPQHFRATKKFSQLEVDQQRMRDLMKKGYCLELGIRLVELLPEDLTFERVQAKFRGVVSLRSLKGHEALVRFLESVAALYRKDAKAWVQ